MTSLFYIASTGIDIAMLEFMVLIGTFLGCMHARDDDICEDTAYKTIMAESQYGR